MAAFYISFLSTACAWRLGWHGGDSSNLLDHTFSLLLFYFQHVNPNPNIIHTNQALPLIRLPSPALSIDRSWHLIGRRRSQTRRRRGVVAVHEELGEDSKVQNQRAGTPDQPAQVDQDVPAVDGRGLAGLAVAALVPVAVRVLAADGLEGEDAQDESEVAEAGEEEEEGVEALGALAAVVEQDLRHAAAEVEDRADVAEDLAPEAEVQGRGLVVGVRVAVFGHGG